jgi:TPR repeat protein
METGDVARLRALADEGFADAQFNYGLLLENGHGTAMDKSLAVLYFKPSADQGDASSRGRDGSTFLNDVPAIPRAIT